MSTAGHTRFQTVSKARPCQVCGGDHKCSRGEDGLIMCGRPPDLVPPGYIYLGRAKGDGQFALYRREGDPHLGPSQDRHRPGPGPGFASTGARNGQETPAGDQAPCGQDLVSVARQLAGNLTPARRGELARALGLPECALSNLPDLGYSPNGYHPGYWEQPCWTFPEVDGSGGVVGLLCRYPDGTKKAMRGSKRGLIVPQGWAGQEGILWAPEGPSDTLTLVALGLATVGRPSNTAGADQLAELLQADGDRRQVVILGEFDPKPEGAWPGRDGATKTAAKLAARLGRPVGWVLPPAGAKDIRAWVLLRGPDPTCADAWHDLGAELLGLLQPGVHIVHLDGLPAGGVTRPEKSLDEADAAELAAASPADLRLDYLPLLGQDGYLVRGWSHLVAGYPRAGKTDLLAACCREWLARGETILYITEEPRSIWQHRLARTPDAWQGMRLVFGLGADRFALLDRARDGEETIVVADTIRGLAILQGDENDNAVIALHLHPWVAAARQRNKTLVLAHHDRKGGGQHGEGIAGGHALLGTVDIALELLYDDAPNRRLLRGFCRLIQPPELLHERGEDGALEALGAPAAVGLAEVRQRVLAVVEGDWLKTAEVAELLDEPKPSGEQLRQALTEEAKAGHLERDPPLADGNVRGKAHRWRRAVAKAD
jgi:hypothetical protein